MFFLYCLICICQNIVCSSLVEDIKNIIIIILIGKLVLTFKKQITTKLASSTISVDPDQTTPLCSGSTLFTSILTKVFAAVNLNRRYF